MEKLIDIARYPVVNVLELLLQDKSTKKNIIWATDTYEEYGEGFSDKDQMNAYALLRCADSICPRILKSRETQAERTRKKAEVFTPAWLCNRMNNYCDEDWFGRRDVFNTENEDHTWTATEGRIQFPKRKKWQRYVDSRRLEITCGEAPFLVSRYDVSTGELIVPPARRIGMLDRKLRIVNENTDAYDEWLKWAIRAVEASYGYEYQGDNVLLARINMLLTFADYYEERWKQYPDAKLLQHVANKIAWNIWQMDGLKDTVPFGKPYEKYCQEQIPGTHDTQGDESENVPCRMFNWRSDCSLKFLDLKEMRAVGKKLFDYVIGNPPYQEETKDTSDKPVYNHFMDAAYEVADKVELIHPARFLFNAGKTPKAWNEKMLNDPHFKVEFFEQNSDKVFPNTDIKGGIAITYRDSGYDFGAIEVFTHFEELRTIKEKVVRYESSYLDGWVYAPESYKLTDKLHSDFPNAEKLLSNGHKYDLTTNIFEKLGGIVFLDEMNDDCIGIYGLLKGIRCTKYIKSDYIKAPDNFKKWKVFLPKSNGSGAIGEVLSTPLVGEPLVGHTQSFISIGSLDTEYEANTLLKYIKTKFSRTMLGILKVTQDNKKGVWKYVPRQNFTENSDIDWSKSIHEIDLQLYRKYGLDEKEIEFIESHVKEMA